MAYDAAYFDWQKDMGAFGGMANRVIFSPYLRSDDTVLDLGCGGGYLLKNLPGMEKIGVEINPAARRQAVALGITAYGSIREVPEGFASVVISNHALEHFESPFQALVDLRPKIREGGRLVFVVPHEGPREDWRADDINQHLYTWNPMTLGNLFAHAGYRIQKVEILRHRWPKRYQAIYTYFGEKIFHLVCKLEAYRAGNFQIRILAEK